MQCLARFDLEAGITQPISDFHRPSQRGQASTVCAIPSLAGSSCGISNGLILVNDRHRTRRLS
jgi:hypothetical protein